MTRIISRSVTGGGQVVRYLEVLEDDGHRLRVDIKADSCRSQSHARVERWDGQQWHEAHRIPALGIQTNAEIGYTPAWHNGNDMKRAGFFMTDRDELLRVANRLIG